MKTPLILRITILLTLASLFCTCKKNNDDQDTIAYKKTGFEITEANKNEPVFNADSLKNIGIEDGVLYNIGVGRNKYNNEFGISIFNPQISIKSILTTSLNELSAKKIIAAWDYTTTKSIADSVIINELKLDSSFTFDYNNIYPKNDSLIYICIIYLQKFGTVKLDLTNPKINDFLTYKTNLFNLNENHGIIMLPITHEGIYGHEFTNSITLGIYEIGYFVINGATFNSKTYKEAIKESAVLLKKLVDENAKWDNIKKSSIYLKNSSIKSLETTGTPGFGLVKSIENFVEKINESSSEYRKWHFGIFSKGYLPFSELYPTYNFIE